MSERADFDYRCCALNEGHDGPCVWLCNDCNGTGRCLFCETECYCDDVVQCEWCDGDHDYPAGCYEGRFMEGDR